MITKLTVLLEVTHAEDDDNIKIKFSAWFGLLKYTINIPLIKVDDDSPSIIVKQKDESPTNKQKKKTTKVTPKKISHSFHDFKLILDRVLNLRKIMVGFLKKITITKFEWHSSIGVGDAAQTGILSGIGWTIKGTLVGMISHFMRMKTKPIYSINPSFQKAMSQTSLVCMFHFRIGHAIVAGLKLLKRWRGGKPKFKSRTLSKIPGTESKKSV